MTVIAVYSVKGGVGKTTLAVNLAYCSAMVSCRRTLLWDLDAAGGAGYLLGLDPKTKHAAESIFARNKAPSKLIEPTRWPRLDVLPADESIRALDRQLLQIGKRKRLARLTEKLAQDYERIILDCPPVLNEVSAQIIRAADMVIVPLPPSPLSRRALDLVVQEVSEHGRSHPPVLPVLSMLDMRRTLHRNLREEHPEWPAIPLASVVEQSAVRREPVGAFAPASPAGRAFRSVWTMIERKREKG
ncbi:MAG: ParA family protein [Sphingomonadaceae bacterium]